MHKFATLAVAQSRRLAKMGKVVAQAAVITCPDLQMRRTGLSQAAWTARLVAIWLVLVLRCLQRVKPLRFAPTKVLACCKRGFLMSRSIGVFASCEFCYKRRTRWSEVGNAVRFFFGFRDKIVSSEGCSVNTRDLHWAWACLGRARLNASSFP